MEFDAKFENQIIGCIVQSVAARHRKTTITKDMNLHRDLGIDSLGMVALVFRLEKIFGLDLSQTAGEIDVRGLRTVGDLIELSQKLLEQAGAR
jgi:acyl carrier protein